MGSLSLAEGTTRMPLCLDNTRQSSRVGAVVQFQHVFLIP